MKMENFHWKKVSSAAPAPGIYCWGQGLSWRDHYPSSIEKKNDGLAPWLGPDFLQGAKSLPPPHWRRRWLPVKFISIKYISEII